MSEKNEVGEAAGEETTGKWITRRDAADLAGCSIDTIKRAEKKHGFTERYDDTTKEKLLSVVELVRYGVIDPCQATVPESSMTRSRVERDNSDLRSKRAAAARCVRGLGPQRIRCHSVDDGDACSCAFCGSSLS